VTDRRTDRRTDEFAIAYSALSMLSRAKNYKLIILTVLVVCDAFAVTELTELTYVSCWLQVVIFVAEEHAQPVC